MHHLPGSEASRRLEASKIRRRTTGRFVLVEGHGIWIRTTGAVGSTVVFELSGLLRQRQISDTMVDLGE